MLFKLVYILMSTPNTKYEFYTIHTDSISSNTWSKVDDSSTQHSYTNFLFRPLENIVQMSILTANFDAVDSNVAYLYSPQLQSHYNDMAGVQKNDAQSFTVAEPSTKDKIRYSLSRFNAGPNGTRSKYLQQDYSTQTQYVTPIVKLDRIVTELYDERGDLLDINNSNVFVSYRFTCLKPHLPLMASKKINNI